MRIVFIGAGDIGLPSLEALIAAGEHTLVAVVTQPDKPVGRSQKLTPSAIKLRAQAAGVPILQPEKISGVIDELQALRADVFVVVAYGQILSRTVLNIPVKACLNVHASLLPRHRGASPIQAAIREGDADTGIAIMWMDEGLDTGDVLFMEPIAIAPDDTGGSLHDRLAATAPRCLMPALQMIAAGNAPRIPQDSTRATLTKKLERHHGHIVWDQCAEEIERLIRAYDPWPGTYALLHSGEVATTQIKIHRVRVVEEAEACPVGGTVIAADKRLLVACGSGVIELLEVQAEGRKRMSAADFLRGHPVAVGTRLL